MRRLVTVLLAFAATAGAAAALGAFDGGARLPRVSAEVWSISGAVAQSPAPDRAVVWAVGDADPTAGGRALAARIQSSVVDRLIYLGDVYETGTAEEFATRYDPLYGKLASRTYPTPGNHEWGNRATGYFPYWRARRGGRALPAWYSSRVAGWQLLSLNSEARHDARSPQVAWLRRQVRRRGSCRIAFWHKPRFSASTRHGDAPDMAPVWNALRGRARVVLNGHDHDSQRLFKRDGISTFVAGGGGRALYEVDQSDPRLVWGDDDTHAALRLQLSRGRARFAFVAADGRVLHAGSMRCRPLR